MGALEQISQMKSQGLQESEIISQLKEQGISPREINDALSQSQVKDAVYNPREETPQSPIPTPPNQTSEATYVPKTQEQGESYAPQPQENYVAPPQEEYTPPQETYQQTNYEYPQESYSTDTIIDIAEQVFSEKIKKIENQIDKLKDTQTILQTQVEHSTEKLKRIESFMDKLQIAILEKIGSYGSNLESMKKEMGMIEDSFSKIIPHAKKHTAKKKTTKRKTSKKK
jgi:DNA-binding transcriptional MerR regulator